jgi:hypothetical protein
MKYIIPENHRNPHYGNCLMTITIALSKDTMEDSVNDTDSFDPLSVK